MKSQTFIDSLNNNSFSKNYQDTTYNFTYAFSNYNSSFEKIQSKKDITSITIDGIDLTDKTGIYVTDDGVTNKIQLTIENPQSLGIKHSFKLADQNYKEKISLKLFPAHSSKIKSFNNSKRIIVKDSEKFYGSGKSSFELTTELIKITREEPLEIKISIKGGYTLTTYLEISYYFGVYPVEVSDASVTYL